MTCTLSGIEDAPVSVIRICDTSVRAGSSTPLPVQELKMLCGNEVSVTGRAGPKATYPVILSPWPSEAVSHTCGLRSGAAAVDWDGAGDNGVPDPVPTVPPEHAAATRPARQRTT